MKKKSEMTKPHVPSANGLQTGVTYKGVHFESGVRYAWIDDQWRCVGSYMGMAEYGDHPPKNKVRVFRLPLDSGGYFRTGAYFGMPNNLYVAVDREGEYRKFVRASSRRQAIQRLGLTNEHLIIKEKVYGPI